MSGVKHDAGKSRMDLFPLDVMKAVGDVLAFGAAKYAEHGWKAVPNAPARYKAALLRHLEAMERGEERDSESGLTHAAHMVCNAVFLCWFHMRGIK